MQTSLMFFDLKSLGITPDNQKIAIKIAAGEGGGDVNAQGEFAGMISALMTAMSPEQLQHSLGEMAWVPMEMEGESPGYTPLLDLSLDSGKAILAAKQLLQEPALNPTLNQPAQNALLGQSTSNNLSLMVSSNPVVATSEPVVMAPEVVGGQNVNSAQAATEHSAMGPRTMETITIQGERLLGDLQERPSPDGSQKQSGLFDAPASGRKKAKSAPAADDARTGQRVALSAAKDDAIAKQQSDAPQAQKESLTTPDKNKVAGVGLNPGKEMPTAVTQAEVHGRKRIHDRDSRPSPMDSILKPVKVKLSTDRQTGQQTMGDKDQPAELFTKLESKVKARSSRPSEAALLSSAADAAQESSESQVKGGVEPRESFQSTMAKIKSSIARGVEQTTGGKEMNPAPQDVQSNVIRQIVQRMTLQSSGLQSTMNIKLKPEFLGNIHMQISTDHQQVIVRMATESLAVKEMVEQGLQHLKSELQHHGLEIDKFEVFVANDDEDSKPGQDLAGFRQALKRQRRDAMKQNRRDQEEAESHTPSELETQSVNNGSKEIDYFA